MKRASSRTPSLSFRSKLERISDEAEYYALSVPEKISRALKTRSAVPVVARVNGSAPFRGSLFPVGGGRHFMRVKASVRREAKIAGGDRVRVEITVADRVAEAADVPRDLVAALRAERSFADFQTLPPGQRSFLLRRIDQAARPETRGKRIREAVEAAQARREKRADRAT